MYVCVYRHQSYISKQCLTHKHTHQMNCHSRRVGVMTHSGDGEADCLQSEWVYVWRSDTMALWQWWWVLLVSAQCIWHQGFSTVDCWCISAWQARWHHSKAIYEASQYSWPQRKSLSLCIWNKLFLLQPITNEKIILNLTLIGEGISKVLNCNYWS